MQQRDTQVDGQGSQKLLDPKEKVLDGFIGKEFLTHIQSVYSEDLIYQDKISGHVTVNLATL